MTYKEFWASKFGTQVYSFIKTYITVFIGIWLFAFQNQPEGQVVTLFDPAVLLPAAQWAFIAVLRNFYKLLTEKK